MPKVPFRSLLVALLGLSLIASSCGSSGGGTSSGSKGTITFGAFDFPESNILASIYGGALKDAGYTVKYRANLGNRQLVAPAVQRGDIDLYAGYTASDLEFFDGQKQLATTSAQENAQQLNTFLQPKGLKALTPARATDENAFAVTKQTASRYHLQTLSELAPVSNQLVFGGPPNCPGRKDCLTGLEQVYKIHFKDGFQSLDEDGPKTYDALQKGDIQVGVVFSSDGLIAQRGLVVLQDDKHIVSADAVIPIGRSKVLTPDVARVLDGVSAKLTTGDLTSMNRRAIVNKDDPSAIAADWLKSHGYKA